MMLSVSFGPVSLFLSAIGINGVFAYLVTQRSREVSIRIASGSTSRVTAAAKNWAILAE